MNNFALTVTDNVSQALVDQLNSFVVQSRADKFSFFATGGSQAKLCYPGLGAAIVGPDNTLNNMDMYLGDERLVPTDNEDSNTALVERLLGKQFSATGKRLNTPTRRFDAQLPELDQEQIHNTSELTPQQVALLGEIARSFEESIESSAAPRVVHLGLGPDGHIASIFPKSRTVGPILKHCATVADVTGLNQHLRVTVKLEFINLADLVILSVTGNPKGDVLRSVLENPQRYPAGKIEAKNFVIIVDRQASQSLYRKNNGLES